MALGDSPELGGATCSVSSSVRREGSQGLPGTKNLTVVQLVNFLSIVA